MGPFVALAEVCRELSLLAAATPTNAKEERARLCRAFEAGGEAMPRWVYSTCDVRRHRGRILAASAELERRGDPLIHLCRARCAEMLVECDAAESVGYAGLARAAVRRFGTADAPVRHAAVALAEVHTAHPPAVRRSRPIATDGPGRSSLLGRVRAEVERLCLPFDVRTSDRLSALAATGERTIWVASGRAVSARVARRTALHEIHGHALPRVRARRMPHALFVIGTAGGVDDQEGLALEIERRGGFLDAERLFELGARHRAALAMHEGATFVDVVRVLRGMGADVPLAVLSAERVFRGSDGRSPGLGRERVYLEAYVRVRAHLEHTPEDEVLLASGQVAVGALATLRTPFGSAPRDVGAQRADL